MKTFPLVVGCSFSVQEGNGYWRVRGEDEEAGRGGTPGMDGTSCQPYISLFFPKSVEHFPFLKGNAAAYFNHC